jgi:hypothetical protein
MRISSTIAVDNGQLESAPKSGSRLKYKIFINDFIDDSAGQKVDDLKHLWAILSGFHTLV